MKNALIIVTLALIAPAFGQDEGITSAINVLSAPQKVDPNTKDCSPEDKLTIDCRAIREKLFAHYNAFKASVDSEITYESAPLDKFITQTVLADTRVNNLLKEYKAKSDLQASPKVIKNLRYQISQTLKYKSEVKCFFGPDMYIYNPKLGKCEFGKKSDDPYSVTMPTLIEKETGELAISACRIIRYEPVGFTVCAEKDLTTGATWIDRVGAIKAVYEIKERERKVGKKTDYYFSKGAAMDLFDIKAVVDAETKKNHKECVPLIP